MNSTRDNNLDEFDNENKISSLTAKSISNEIKKISSRKNSKEIIENNIRSNKSKFCATSRRLASF